MHRLFALLVVLLALGLVAPAAALAQDASPAANPAAGPCEAPELPPGTPTPMEASPAAETEATPGVDEEQTDAEIPAEATPAPAPAGTPATGDEAAAAEAALTNLVNCINGKDYLAVAALASDDFIRDFLNVPTPYDVPATFEGVQPVAVRSLGNAQAYADGAVSVDVVYAGLFNGPGGLGSDRWFFAEDDGVYKLDNVQPVPLPAGMLPGATVVDVRMVDFAFVLDASKVPAGPVILRTTNAGDDPHVNVVATLREGTSVEEVIEGAVDVDEAFVGFFGALFLMPGQTGDLAFERLEPGTYFLVCDVTTADGTPHFELGMVTEITVE